MISLLNQPLPFEELRIGLAFIFLTLSSYFDVFNNKNIPDKFLYFILFISALTAFFLFPFNAFLYGLIQALIVGGITYFMYLKGHIGGAEVFLFSSISLLFPNPPIISGVVIGLPFILPVLIFAGLLFALSMLIYAFIRIGIKRVNVEYIILLIVYLLFITYVLINNGGLPLPFVFVISILFFASLYFSAHKKEIEKLMIGEVEVEKALEEVVALEYERKKVKELFKEPVVKKGHIKQLKKRGIKKIRVFKHLPPFIPFLMAGFLLALLFTDILLPF